MNKRQKEVLQASLDNEKEVLKALEKNYTKALADIKKNIRELQAMPQTQSKAYQIEFQKQLESQISAYLDVLKGNNYKTITEYMSKCYEEGFVGSVYCLQGFGEGITIPIDQETVIKAVKLTGDDLKLSEKLEGNTKLLKQNVLAEMQRGFASELSYADIARNISNWGNADMNRSKTIARTEGHRVQCKADIDCAYKARELGCDTVKQWNSTLDGKTRSSHQKLDKEWRELDEPFSNGLMYPGDPNGKAAEVVNCRCGVDDVPRWYVEKGGGQYRRNNITGEIIKCRDYVEFKEKYLLNDAEKYALNQYIGSKSYAINEKLRKGVPLTSEEKGFIMTLDSALNKMPKYKGNLNRSLIFDDESALDEFLSNYKAGNTIVYDEYISTTCKGVYNPDGQVQIHIFGASSGRDITTINKGENEVLYQRNSSFKIISIVEENETIKIYMKEVK